MVEMAKRGLSIFVLPMPLAGVAGPVYPIANAIIGAAEILGVWTMAKAIREDVPIEAAVVSGALNPKTGGVCFSGPETLLQDLAVAQLFRERYGLRCSTGPGIIDAPVPGPLSIYERTLKNVCTALAGEPMFNAGILGGGVVFSPEQLMIDLEIASAQHALCRGAGGDRFEESLELIRERGIGGLFIDTDHTASVFRDCLWIPDLLHRFKGTDAQYAMRYDPVDEAYERWKAVLNRTELYSIDDVRRGAIDRVVDRAEALLVNPV
jgi:trimethylamine:corrinoid methyltransferase-like protein